MLTGFLLYHIMSEMMNNNVQQISTLSKLHITLKIVLVFASVWGQIGLQQGPDIAPKLEPLSLGPDSAPATTQSGPKH